MSRRRGRRPEGDGTGLTSGRLGRPPSARSAASDELPRSHVGEVAALLCDLAGHDRVAVATGWTAEARPTTRQVVDELLLRPMELVEREDVQVGARARRD